VSDLLVLLSQVEVDFLASQELVLVFKCNKIHFEKNLYRSSQSALP